MSNVTPINKAISKGLAASGNASKVPPTGGGGDGMEARIAGIERDVHALKSDVSTLKTDVHTLKTDVAVLKASMATKDQVAAIPLETIKWLFAFTGIIAAIAFGFYNALK